ncbi:hypothetical protein GQ43DRAFT_5691 [Delitschia confertaspora ATCC 74209]|uniref:GPI anchored protein n=1 Tax=Delitschia confertaspora ATCC 74209 TaxID=1513339 RepID=A0A9P4JPW6_9PLEO|nr:hypothetical protein GQ43DRAFT_5691 [Delitschia confertaspora ATCC 74209]
MGFFELPRVSLLLLLCYLGTEIGVSSLSLGAPSDSGRVLKAATRRSDLFRRDTRIRRNFDANLAYIESENGFQSNSIFASQVRVKSEAPILSLEDIEHHLSDVQCSAETMKLSFVSGVSKRDAHHACKHEKGGYIITSHSTCNAEGERSVFKIKNIALSEDEFGLELSVEEISFKQAFSKVDIDFGYTNDGHLFRRHPHFQRRQAASTTAVKPAATSSEFESTITFTSSIQTPLPLPTITIPENISDSDRSASFNLTFSKLNSAFSNPLPIGVPNPAANVPLTVECKNCTTGGVILLTRGSFNIDISRMDVIPEAIDGKEGSAFDVIEKGFLELEANSVNAHIELTSTPTQSGSYSLALFELPIVGFAIPKIGRAGVSFNGTIQTAYKVSGGIEFTYGFELNVPTGSKFQLDLGNLSSTGISGFNATQFTALPFSANATDFELELSAGFRPAFPMGFSFFDGRLAAQVDMFMDLPQLSAKLSTKSQQQTDASCNPPSPEFNGTTPRNSTITPVPTPSISTSPFLPATAIPAIMSDLGPLLHIQPSIHFALGVGAHFEADPLPPFATQTTIFKTAFAIPTACLAVKSKFAPAQKAFEDMTSSYVASASSVSEASRKAAEATATGGGGADGKAKETGGAKSVGGRLQAAGDVRAVWSLCVVGLGVVAGGMVML